MSEIKITDMIPLRTPARANGDRVVCRFNCEMRGIRLVSCSLLKRANGDLFVQLPTFRIAGKAGSLVHEKCRVHIFDKGLMNGLRKAASQAYEENIAAQQAPA